MDITTLFNNIQEAQATYEVSENKNDLWAIWDDLVELCKKRIIKKVYPRTLPMIEDKSADCAVIMMDYMIKKNIKAPIALIDLVANRFIHDYEALELKDECFVKEELYKEDIGEDMKKKDPVIMTDFNELVMLAPLGQLMAIITCIKQQVEPNDPYVKPDTINKFIVRRMHYKKGVPVMAKGADTAELFWFNDEAKTTRPAKDWIRRSLDTLSRLKTNTGYPGMKLPPCIKGFQILTLGPLAEVAVQVEVDGKESIIRKDLGDSLIRREFIRKRENTAEYIVKIEDVND